jgi:hypothetical protein
MLRRERRMRALTLSEMPRLAAIVVMWSAGMADPLVAQEESFRREAGRTEATKWLDGSVVTP